MPNHKDLKADDLVKPDVKKVSNSLASEFALFEALVQPKRVGFLKEGEITVPDDFNRMGEAEMAALFGEVS